MHSNQSKYHSLYSFLIPHPDANTTMNIFRLTLLFCTLLLAACSEDYPDHAVDSLPADLQISSTLSNLRISSIAVDQEGYVWLGTSRGLNRYNGDDMHQYFCNDEPNAIPDNRINSVFCDSKGRVWVTTKNGVARYTDQDDFEQIPISYNNPRCQNMAENSLGEIFVIQTNVVLKYNAEGNCFEKAIEDVSYIDPFYQDIFIDEENHLWIVDDRSITSYSTITCKQIDSLDLGPDPEIQTAALIGSQLWIATTQGLLLYDVIARQWLEVPVSIREHYLYDKSRLHTIICVSERYILFGSGDGVFLYNPSTGRVLHQNDPQFPMSPPNFIVTHALSDSNGNLWLCSDTQGFEVRQQRSNRFNSSTPYVNALVGKPVMALSYDHQQTLWVATEDEGLYCYDTKTNSIAHFDKTSVLESSSNTTTHHINSRILSLYVDHKDDIWISTTPKGLVQMRRRGDKLEFVNFYDLPSVIVMQEDQEGSLWAGCYGNTYYSKRPYESQFREHHLFSNTFSYLSCMQLLHDGSFAILVREQGLRYINPDTQEQTAPVIPDSVLQRCIARNIFLPSALREGPDGKLWIGTISNGLMKYDPATGQLENIPGAPCEDIASIEIDHQGNPWVSTQYGIGKYNVSTQTFTNYYNTDGLGGNEFYDRASCQFPNGMLVFGGPHGLTVFNPLNVPEEQEGCIYLQDLKVHNRLVRPGEGQAITSRLNLCDAIHLRHNQANFSISFSALDYCEEERYNYQYMLEGVNHTWVDAYSNREAVFANISPGSYTFRARITNKDKDRVIAETSIPVHIHPSVWGSRWAWLCYLILIAAVVLNIIRLYRRIRQEKKNRLQSQREREQEHRINQMNMSFFANVSHEFRTPLTVISAPISQLCQDEQLKDEHRRLLKVVNRSVNRMLQLVNQMMDFHKLEDDTLHLEVKRQDVVGFLRNVVEFFSVNAHDKNIDFRTHGLEDICVMWVDLDKLEKILNNLLGNAMKYTQAGGRVDLSLDVVSAHEAQQIFPAADLQEGMQYAKIMVTDNGAGIPEDQRDKIFKRYYQLRNKSAQTFNWGTGIGLYYAHSLVRLHHGQIRVMDNPDGSQGSCFCFILPVNQEAYSESEFAADNQNQASLFPLQDQLETPSVITPTASDLSKPHIMVVDDDVDVIHYLKLLLAKDFRVTCRFDANTALETLRKQDEEVDLVISDVMMPGTSGFQLCQQIKEDDQLCHLPVILVTAKNTVKDQIEGLNAGALAYVTKPFDPAYLQALIKRLLGTRDQTRKALKESTQTPVLEENVLSAQDKAFMNELYRLMEEELSNPDMDVTRLTDMLHVSRSKLYYKIKGLTGENPSSFFKTYKLNRAAELIREGKYNLSEISLLTGFSTLSHFSTSFKRHFGVAPSEY